LNENLWGNIGEKCDVGEGMNESGMGKFVGKGKGD
jgi:hypothetical protein